MKEKQVTIKELEPMLINIAAIDLADGANINEHPCMVIFRMAEELSEKLEAAERHISFMKSRAMTPEGTNI